MRRKGTYLALLAFIASGVSAHAQDYFDDIYYNPKTDETAAQNKKGSVQSTYIANMADMDVDAYNRRSEVYYTSEIDTIGNVVENGEDFVYTQQIQKYYNPTIVVDNSAALGDILSEARGNVEIVINDYGNPVFAPYYGYGWGWPYYSSIWSPWNWGGNIGPWGWSVGFYDPWFSWGWGPGWWNPAPVWRPGRPGFGPPPGPVATWNPRGNRPAAPRPGWSGANINRNMMASHRPMGNVGTHPGNAPGVTKPNGVIGNTRPAGVVKNNGRWEYKTPSTRQPNVSGAKPVGNGSVRNGSLQRNPTTQHTTKGNVSSPSSGNSKNSNTTLNRNNTNRSYSPSRSTGSGGGSRPAGGRSGGGNRGGGGGRHR